MAAGLGVSLRRVLVQSFHFKGKFRFNWLFDEVKHTPIGLGALIRGENALLEG